MSNDKTTEFLKIIEDLYYDAPMQFDRMRVLFSDRGRIIEELCLELEKYVRFNHGRTHLDGVGGEYARYDDCRLCKEQRELIKQAREV